MSKAQKPAPVVPATEKKPFSPIESMVAWEEGELSDEDTDILFQYLIDTGMAWMLQGMYGREAMRLIEAGRCHRKEG